jgi:hypothetical protein
VDEHVFIGCLRLDESPRALSFPLHGVQVLFLSLGSHGSRGVFAMTQP